MREQDTCVHTLFHTHSTPLAPGGLVRLALSFGAAFPLPLLNTDKRTQLNQTQAAIFHVSS
jgi:hypothetical protein